MSRIAAANAANMIEASDPEALIRAQAQQEADRLGAENQARIESMVQDQSDRATGMTNYGQEVEQPVADYLGANAAQADLARQHGREDLPPHAALRPERERDPPSAFAWRAECQRSEPPTVGFRVCHGVPPRVRADQG